MPAISLNHLDCDTNILTLPQLFQFNYPDAFRFAPIP